MNSSRSLQMRDIREIPPQAQNSRLIGNKVPLFLPNEYPPEPLAQSSVQSMNTLPLT